MNRLVPWIMPTATALIVGCVAHSHFGKPFWPAFLTVFFAVLALGLIQGLIMMFEDEMPGGYNNPDGIEPTPWVQRARKIMWATVGFLTLLTALAIWASRAGYW